VLSSATITIHDDSDQVDSGQTKIRRKKEVSGSSFEIEVTKSIAKPLQNLRNIKSIRLTINC
jgi:hypothetical protein